ncbi:LEA type 2 family protein [Spirochaetota bacterium]
MKIYFLVVFFAFIIISCASLNLQDIIEKPKATIEKTTIDSMTLRDITFLFTVKISNPYPVGITLKDMIINFSIEGNQFFKTSTGKGLKIASRGSEVSDFKVNIKYADIIKIVKAYNEKDILETVIDAEIIIPLPKFVKTQDSISFTYQLKKNIPAIKPKISIKNFSVKTPELAEVKEALIKTGKKSISPENVLAMFKGITEGKSVKEVIKPEDIDVKFKVGFDIELKNEARSKLVFRNLQYDFLINAEKLIAGTTTDIKTANNISIIHIENEFSSKSLSKSIASAFKERKGDFSVIGSSTVKLPDAIKKEPLTVSFNESGGLEIGK